MIWGRSDPLYAYFGYEEVALMAKDGTRRVWFRLPYRMSFLYQEGKQKLSLHLHLFLILFYMGVILPKLHFCIVSKSFELILRPAEQDNITFQTLYKRWPRGRFLHWIAI